MDKKKKKNSCPVFSSISQQQKHTKMHNIQVSNHIDFLKKITLLTDLFSSDELEF